MKIAQIIGFLICIAIALVLIVYFQSYLEPITDWLSDPLWVSVLVTVVLVGINAFYAIQMRQTINEMEKARKTEFMPNIRAELTFLGPVFLLLRMANVGKGPAIDVKAEISFSPSNETRLWEQGTMSPDESIRIFLPDGSLDRVCETAARIMVKGDYMDIFGQKFRIDKEIDTKEFIENMKQLRQIIEPDVSRILRQINDELRELKIAVRDIERNLRQHDQARS